MAQLNFWSGYVVPHWQDVDGSDLAAFDTFCVLVLACGAHRTTWDWLV